MADSAESDAMPRRCRKKGHRWRQKIMYVCGTDVCARRGCTAQRTNPLALPPWGDLDEYLDLYDQQPGIETTVIPPGESDG